MKRVLFTGGGSAGHVIPNLALIEKCQEAGINAIYAGSKRGIERGLIKRAGLDKKGIPYYVITSGKLRRYFSWENFIDPFKICFGIMQALMLCLKLKPNLVFSKGGFVAFPVVVAAWLCRIPIIAHESDLTPGLANNLSALFAKKICLTFADTERYFRGQKKTVVTGVPIRKSLFQGDPALGYTATRLTQDRPILLVMGGGSGAVTINLVIREALAELLSKYQIIHICGLGQADKQIKLEGYKQYEYVNDELPHLLSIADLVISRAGSNTINELLALGKPHVLIPLSKKVSRGEQVDNADYMHKQGLSAVIAEEALTKNALLKAVAETISQRDLYTSRMAAYNATSGTENVFKLIEDVLA